MKRLAGLSALALLISSTSGCGWIWGDKGYFRDRGSDYLNQQRAAPMQVPEGLQVRSLEPLLPIPDHVADVHHSGKYELPRPNALSSASHVSEYSLQKTGQVSYLVAQRSPAEVWPLVRQFLTDNGVQIEQENARNGEFISAWQAPEQLSSRVAQSLSASSGSEVRLRVRVEPGVQRNTSEIYLATAERALGSKDSAAWTSQPQAQDALLNAMLQSAEQTGSNGSVSLLVARDYDAPERVNLSADGSGNPVLTLDTDLNRAWSSVGRALEKADVRVDDLNRSTAVYYINLSEAAKEAEKPGFFGRLIGRGDSEKDIEARAKRYQVRLTEVSGRVQISVEKDLNTAADAETARQILDLIQNNLG